ncbi:MAG: hypothetical protein IMW89_16910 [Ktedonobacteraceae bacterium]|nr:hypothetical protein [Ktedonobacteraceae bacterium]
MPHVDVCHRVEQRDAEYQDSQEYENDESEELLSLQGDRHVWRILSLADVPGVQMTAQAFVLIAACNMLTAARNRRVWGDSPCAVKPSQASLSGGPYQKNWCNQCSITAEQKSSKYYKACSTIDTLQCRIY